MSSRVGRLRGNKDRHQRASKPHREDGIRIVVATSPQLSPSGPQVTEDIRLVKSAVLYADHVELLSPTALSLQSMQLAAADVEGFYLSLMETFDEPHLRWLGFQGDIDSLRRAGQLIRELKGTSRQQRRAHFGASWSKTYSQKLKEFREDIENGDGNMRSTMSDIWTGAGGAELEAVAEAGLLSLSPDAFNLDSSGKVELDSFVEALRRLLADPHSHLLFDDDILKLVGAMVREKAAEVNPVTAETAKKIATGTGLIERLPSFPDAPVSELIRTRSDLSEALIRYRGAIKDMSSKLVSKPLDVSLGGEVGELWYDEVAPALLSLKNDLAQTRLVHETAKNLASDVKTVVSGGVGVSLTIGVQEALQQAHWTGAMVGVGGALLATVKAAREPLEARSAARSHKLYYLLAVDHQLGGGKGGR